jgi:hypothetical protein
MNAKVLALLLICMATVAAAGCTSGSPSAATPAPTSSGVATSVPTTPADSLSCISDTDCVPAQCCHPASCMNRAAAAALSCGNKLCTMSCEGPLDCGAGSCGCVNGKCGVVPAHPAPVLTLPAPSVRLETTPQRYSPMMSSTPGIGLTPNVTGFVAADASFERKATDITWSAITFEWNATYGEFLTWDAPDYTVHQIGNQVANSGGKVYWTFTEKPASTKDPVIITVTARDMTRRGAVLGSSMVTLSWDGDYAVYVRNIT